MGLPLSQIICYEENKWKVGDAVKTPYGIGKIIHIRNENHVPLVIVLSYSLGYFNLEDVEPYHFTREN